MFVWIEHGCPRFCFIFRLHDGITGSKVLYADFFEKKIIAYYSRIVDVIEGGTLLVDIFFDAM